MPARAFAERRVMNAKTRNYGYSNLVFTKGSTYGAFMKLNLVLAASALALVATAGSASAYIACNAGDCWHTDRRVHAPGVTFDYHPDDWYFHQHWDADRHFRDYHDGRGYYRNGVWITL